MNETTSQSGAALASAGRLAWIAFIVAVLVGGVNAVAVRFTVAELPPFWGATLRFGLAAALFWVASLARRESFPRGRELQGVLLYGILNFGLGYAFLYVGIIELGAGLTQVVLALGPLITFFLALAHRLETFQWRPLIGALLAVGGIAMAFVQRPEGSLPLLSLLYIVAGTAAFSESIIVIKKYPPAPMLMTNALAATVGAVFLLLGSVLAGESRALPQRPETWAAIGYLAVFGTFIFFYLVLYVNREMSAMATSYMFVLLPFVTVTLAARLANEPLTPALLLGAVLVVVGVWFGALARGKTS